MLSGNSIMLAVILNNTCCKYRIMCVCQNHPGDLFQPNGLIGIAIFECSPRGFKGMLHHFNGLCR